MISEPTPLQQPMPIVASRTSGAPIRWQQFAALAGVLRRSAHNLWYWARVPALPYAVLWEASVIAGMLREPEYFEPDPFSGETPFLRDSWLQG